MRVRVDVRVSGVHGADVVRRFDPKWQLRRCHGCFHEERFPALNPMEAVCSACRRRTKHTPLCLCGCGTKLLNLARRDTLYAARSHSTRAWKARVDYDARRRREASPAA